MYVEPHSMSFDLIVNRHDEALNRETYYDNSFEKQKESFIIYPEGLQSFKQLPTKQLKVKQNSKTYQGTKNLIQLITDLNLLIFIKILII
jgi:hypothetical protein